MDPERSAGRDRIRGLRTLAFPLSFLLCGLGFTGFFRNEIAGPAAT